MRILVTPRPGKKVRDPNNPARGHLPEQGLVALDGSAWRRLESAGDVTITPAPAETDAPARQPVKK